MLDDSQYKPTIPQVMIELLKDNFKSLFRTYREGDPIIFPASMLPAIFISEPTTDYEQGATGFDVISHEILIQLVFNKKDEFGAPQGVATMDNTIDHYIHGRDPVTGFFLSSSIMGVLRKNITLNNLTINQTAKVQKYVLPRSEQMTTAEAHVRITVEEEQQIPNRL